MTEETDHCRIGSLEILSGQLPSAYARSLPHRQLRNMNPDDGINRMGSLPHRQLRNCMHEDGFPVLRSLPHRQLRKNTTERRGQR